MEDPALSVFSEARHEYMKQLSQVLRQPFMNFFLEQLSIAREEMRESPKKYLWQFQNRLKGIKEWNSEKVRQEINKIEMASNCDFLQELITAIFIAHTKLMAAIRINSRKKVNISVPKYELYLFRAVCECADLLWGSAFLFRDDITAIDKQKNMRQVEGLVLEGMQQAIRSLLPIKSILKDVVPDDDDEAEAEDEVEHEAPKAVEEPRVVEEAKVVEEVKAVEEPEAKETKIEEFKVPEETVAQETVTVEQEPIKQEPVVVEQEPIKQESIANEPVKHEPVTHDPNTKHIGAVDKAPVHNSVIVNKMEPEVKATEEVIELSGSPTEEEEPKKVHFSEYNMVFNEETGVVEHAPMDTSSDGFTIMEGSEKPLDDDDFESL